MNKKISLLMITMVIVGCSCGIIHNSSQIKILIQQENESYNEFLIRCTEITGELHRSEYKITDAFYWKVKIPRHPLGFIVIYEK